MACLISFKNNCSVLELYKLSNGWYEYNSEGRLSYKISVPANEARDIITQLFFKIF
jgi:hypothetical protein